MAASLFAADEQHHHLVDIINQFGELLGQNKVASAVLEKVFGELLAYAHYHFREEEALLARFQLDWRRTLAWQCQHRVAARTPGMANCEALLKMADDSVYPAKRAGKNCVRSLVLAGQYPV